MLQILYVKNRFHCYAFMYIYFEMSLFQPEIVFRLVAVATRMSLSLSLFSPLLPVLCWRHHRESDGGKKSTRPRCSRGRKSTNISHNTQQSRTGGSVKHVGSTLAVKSIRCSCVGAVCPNLTKPGRGRR